ncbi:MAG TPA: hypothetical protein VN641_07070, partial [Urbifossiella sp.]|nr:hypothetical protein [Urbifossiella sp.]
MKVRLLFSGLLALAIGVSALGQVEKPLPPRVPVPDGAAIEEADKLIRDLYKAEFAKKKASDRIDLAAKLAAAAAETKDAGARFAMFRAARDLAAAGGDVVLALSVADTLAQAFVVKLPEQKLAALEAANKGRVASARIVAEAALEAADGAERLDEYVVADQLLKVATAAASRANVGAVSAAVAAAKKDLDIVRKAYDALEPDRKALAANASDPAANEKLGRFAAFLKGDWAAGLPMLAKSGNERLKAAAELDIKRPLSADRAPVADRWMEELDQLEPAERSEVRQRAYYAYLDALPDLTGLDKTRVEKRIADIRKADAKLSRMAGAWTVIFRSDDPTIWNTAVNKGRDRFAVPLARVRSDVKYLKVTEAAKNRAVIIPMSAKELGETAEAKTGFAWNGKNNLDWSGR